MRAGRGGSRDDTSPHPFQIDLLQCKVFVYGCQFMICFVSEYFNSLGSIAQKCANATYLRHLALLQQHALYSNASRHCKYSSTAGNQAAYPLVNVTYSAAASLIEGAVPQPNHEIATYVQLYKGAITLWLLQGMMCGCFMRRMI